MDPSTAITWFALGVLTKRRYDVLLKRFGDVHSALQHLDQELLLSLGCRKETVERTMALHAALSVGRWPFTGTDQRQSRGQRPTANAEQYLHRLEALGVHLVTWEDDDYPQVLREIGDPPVFLSYRGDLSVLQRPCLGIVGTRAMSSYGRRVTGSFVPDIVGSGVTTVSGLALGIDAAVARETLAHGGKTVAVLGHGLAKIYPPGNAPLAEEIVRSGGLLMSEFPLDVAPDKYTFPSRNRLIAGLCRGVVVIEAGEGSGALITADLALDYSREAFAVPGPVFSEQSCGCHTLIARGEAQIATCAGDILRGIGVLPPDATSDRTLFVPRTPEEAAVYEVLSGLPQSIGGIVEAAGLPTAAVNATMTELELTGAAKGVGGGMWVRK